MLAFLTCSTEGCGKPTTDVDHIQSIRERSDLRLVWANLRPFCHSCHSRHTARTQGFASGRGYEPTFRGSLGTVGANA
ncbi:HNH endonuclease [Aquamicrobium segne]|uniref:HNH endonuclease n=1 Tax=Aquamicrobium segne TaxID=469547 RepID=A0ABW0GZK5_9HYPH